jgi:hypothetical protein
VQRARHAWSFSHPYRDRVDRTALAVTGDAGKVLIDSRFPDEVDAAWAD